MEWMSRKILLIIFSTFLMLISACTPGGGGTRTSRRSATVATDDPNAEQTPIAGPSGQNSTFALVNLESFQTTFPLNSTFSNSFVLTGQIHDFIISGNGQFLSTVQCLAIPFSINSVSSVLVLAANPIFQNVISGRTYFYHIEPNNIIFNNDHCRNQDLEQSLQSQYIGANIRYGLNDICPSCSTSPTSSGFRLFSPSGSEHSEVTIDNLRLQIQQGSSTDPIVGTCETDEQCIRLGRQCCSNEKQCIDHGVIRPDVDQSSPDFLVAKASIEADPKLIFSFPEFYFACQNVVNPEPTPEPTPTPDNPAQAELNVEFKGELLDCLTTNGNEQSVCTLTVENASESLNTVLLTGGDDRNFSSTYSGRFPPGDPQSKFSPSTITEVTYAGVQLFTEGTPPSANDIIIGEFNDTLGDPTEVTIKRALQVQPSDDIVRIKFKVDGSCRRISNGLAQCTKYYVQGQDNGGIDDHFPATTDFKIPPYADTLRRFIVRLDGTDLPIGVNNWSLQVGAPHFVRFVNRPLDGQRIEIEYFVDLTQNPVLNTRQAAQDRVNLICTGSESPGENWTFVPRIEVIANISQIVDYDCEQVVIDDGNDNLDTQQIFLSQKASPHRFFNEDGTGFSNPSSETGNQEGVAFEYMDRNPARPNNTIQYVGFNEIYGSFTTDALSARPAHKVQVRANRIYDIVVTSGRYSGCTTCGRDYYSTLAALFPGTFGDDIGSGYTPQAFRTDRFQNSPIDGIVSTSANYRPDDLLFGRACFVPATMIPWTHRARSNVAIQRRERLAAQHFLFANGYQRDWYGFDYGALIGSFDGVTWFAIGSQRRITTTSTTLYLAINAYAGDLLTSTSNYVVNIGEQGTVANAGSLIDSNFENDGAECQRFHECSTDSDCVGQLGWGYSCELITSMRSSWPQFDIFGNEIGGAAPQRNLEDIFNSGGGSDMRCVYRGKGSPCHENYTQSNTETTYHGTASTRLNACNADTYCQSFDDTNNNNPVPAFNVRVNRYGIDVPALNNSAELASSDMDDEFGLATRSLMRPFFYNGRDFIIPDAENTLVTNKISSICIPGKQVRTETVSSLVDQHSARPESMFNGDKVLGIGMTRRELNTTHRDYVSSCSVLDEEGNYFHLQNPSASLDDPDLVGLAGSQAVSSNSLLLLENGFEDFTENFNVNVVEEDIFEENRCLRAPGSVCFSDYECAPNAQIQAMVGTLDVNALSNQINEYELRYWQEGLVCGQRAEKGTSAFDLTLNRCCRESGNTLTIATDFLSPTETSDNDLKVETRALLPGIDLPFNEKTRNSRIAPVYGDMRFDPIAYPQLISAHKDACGSPEGCQSDELVGTPVPENAPVVRHPQRQWKTFSEIAARTCCSQTWVRNFHSDNGGGHTWSPGRMQNVDKENFECLNWTPCDPLTEICSGRTCVSPEDPNCRARATTPAEERRFNDFMGTLELIGIPQVLVQTNDAGFDENLLGDSDEQITCRINPDNLDALENPVIPATGAFKPIPQTIAPLPIDRSTAEFLRSTEPNSRYYAGHDLDNFIDLKPVFSPDEVTCCRESGEFVGTDANENQCCSGVLNGQTGVCCLPDYTDLSVYYNRFVSGEFQAFGNLSDELFDPETGYMINQNQFEALLIAQNPCCSGQPPVRGIAVSNLFVRGHAGSSSMIRRFISSDTPDDRVDVPGIGFANEQFDNGLRWNTHLYCVPAPTR